MDTLVMVKKLIQQQLKDADVQVSDMTGTNDHIEVQVTSKAFEGKSLIEQHRMIMDIMKESLKGPVHALKIKTRLPKKA